MRQLRALAALTLCVGFLLYAALPVRAAEDYVPPEVSGQTLETLLETYFAEHGLNEKNFALSYYNTVTGESYDFNETTLFYGASTYKLPLNLYYYDLRLAGQITGDTMITRSATLDEAQYQTLVNSDNGLAYSLWRRIGDWPEYKQALRKYFTMTDDEIPDRYYYDHVFCTRMMMDTLKIVWDGQEAYTELIEYLKIACPDAYFKTYLDTEQVPVAHKYGSYEGAENDVGIIWAAQPYLLAVYTTGLSFGVGGQVELAYARGQSAGSEICGELVVLLNAYIDEQQAQLQAQLQAEIEAREQSEEQARMQAQSEAEAQQKLAQQKAETRAHLQEEKEAAEQAQLQAQQNTARQQAERQQAAHRQRSVRIALLCVIVLCAAALTVLLLRRRHARSRH